MHTVKSDVEIYKVYYFFKKQEKKLEYILCYDKMTPEDTNSGLISREDKSWNAH